MRNDNTYNGIFTGMIILLAGAVVWLVVSRERIVKLTADLNSQKLRNESLLSQKLLVEKDLDKRENKINVLTAEKLGLRQSLAQKSEALALQAQEAKRLRTQALQAQDQSHKNDIQLEQLHSKLVESDLQQLKLEDDYQIQHDSVELLLAVVTRLERERDEAITRSIDQTLILAEKRNDKLTTKAKKTNEIVANVELPATLTDLNFTIEAPDGTKLSGSRVDANGTLTVRELTDNTTTASVSSVVPTLLPTKRVEVAYKPEQKLKSGVYVLKIFNGSDYVGSMRVALQ
jgi:hypothetical protein